MITMNSIGCMCACVRASVSVYVSERERPAGCMDVCCECYVLSCRGLCDGLITRTEESYRV